MSAWGLDQLLKLKWPSLTFIHRSGRTVGLSLAWIMIIPLLGSVISVYNFVEPWLVTVTFAPYAKYSSMITQMKPKTVQWMEPPIGDFGFQIMALEQGIKLTDVYHLWVWSGRTPPPPRLQVTEGSVDSSGNALSINTPYFNLRTFPENYYAYVNTSTQEIPCQASANGGNIDIDCQTDTSGQLVVMENLWSGWSVRRDGVAAPLGPGPWLTTKAPAGTHHYAFRYRPWDVPLGVAISLLGFALSIWLWFHRPIKLPESNFEKPIGG